MYELSEVVVAAILGFCAVVVQYYSFGLFLVNHILRVERPLVRFVFAWLLGICTTAVLVFLLGSVIGTYAYVLSLLFFIIGVLNIRTVFAEAKILLALALKQKAFTSFAVLSIVSLYGTLAGTWIRTGDMVRIQAGQLHDSVWHLAVIDNLLTAIPPEHPSSFMYTVENYHYLYDIAHAVVAWTTKLPISVLYFQVFPLIVSVLLACSMILLFPLRKSKTAAYASLFLTFFGGSFAYLIPVFLPGNSWQESSFWVSQTFAVLVNPQLVFSFSLVLFLLWYLQAKLHDPLLRTTKVYAVIVALTTTLVGFKSYGWLIAMALLGLDLLIELVSTRNWKQFLVRSVYTAVIGFVSMYLIIGLQTSSFIYAPLWYLSSMVEAPDRVNNPVWKLLEQHYIANEKWHRLIELKAKELGIFFGGNLGTRVVFLLFPLVWIFALRRKRIQLRKWSYCIVGFLIASVFPLLVLQKNGPVWNSIQFWYYALIFANCLAAATVPSMLSILRFRAIQVVVVALFILATVPTFIQTAFIKYGKNEPLPIELFTALDSELTMADRVFVCPSSHPLYNTALIAALSGSGVYLANPVQLDILFGTTGQELEAQAKEQLRSEYISDGRFVDFLDKQGITKIICTEENVSKQLGSLSQLQQKTYNEIHIFTYAR